MTQPKKTSGIRLGNHSELLSHKFSLRVKEREVISPYIKIEKTEEALTNASNIIEFTCVDDLVATEELLAIHIDDLKNLQTLINEFKSNCNVFKMNCNEFTKENEFGRVYKEKINLIVKYIKCLNKNDKEYFRNQLEKLSIDNQYKSNIDRTNQIITELLQNIKNRQLRTTKRSSGLQKKAHPKSQLETYRSLLSQLSKKKTQHKINMDSDVEYLGTKYPLFVNRKENITPLIKIEPIEEEDSKFEFTNMDDLIMLEAILKIYLEVLSNFQESIDESKHNCNKFTTQCISSEIYGHKTNFFVEKITGLKINKEEYAYLCQNTDFTSTIEKADTLIKNKFLKVIDQVNVHLSQWFLKLPVKVKNEPIDETENYLHIDSALSVIRQEPELIEKIEASKSNSLNAENYDIDQNNFHLCLSLPEKGSKYLNIDASVSETCQEFVSIEKIHDSKSNSLNISNKGKKQSNFHLCLRSSKKRSQYLEKDEFVPNVRLKKNNASKNSKTKKCTLKKIKLKVISTPKCKKIDTSFGSLSTLKIHGNRDTSKKPFKCETCDRRFIKSFTLKRHEMIHTGEKPFKCKICERAFYRSDYLKKHEMKHRGFKSQTPENAFIQSEDLKRQQIIHIGTGKFKCKTCCKTFNNSSHLKTHIMIHTGEKPFKCEICEKGFIQSCNLKKHEMIHTGEKLFKCRICEKGFIQSSNLKRHEMIHNNVKLSKCGKDFIQAEDLKHYQIIHRSKEIFKCKTCGRIFDKSRCLKRHEIIHRDEKSFKCKICGQCFNQTSYLKRHVMTHKSEGSFKFQVGDQRFVRMPHLKHHEIGKTSKRVLTCKTCDMSFNLIDNLKRFKKK